jgi:hypothetical protein
MSLADRVGSKVTVEGTARNGAAGAVVVTSDGPVYLDGLESWDKATDGKRVSARGVLRVQAGGNLVNAKGEHSHGVPGERLVIEAATWNLA